MPLLIGTRLGPYEIVAPLGAGGMGEVYKATDTRLDRTVAIKILPSTDPERRQRFAREAKAIAALSHPNICMLHDVGEQSGTDFLVVEYLEGETLADRLKEGPLTQDTVLDLAIHIADALDAAHAAHIIHRDLKPQNIFITKRGQAKVLDFGLAKLSAPRLSEGPGPPADLPTVLAPALLTNPGSTLGTVAYMSPEQARGDDIDHRSDLFSFGAVLYEMATGRAAFPGRTTAVIFDEILNKTPTAPGTVNPGIPPQLERVITKALKKDRERRYQHAADLRADLEQVRRDVAGGGGSDDAHERTARVARRRRRVVAAGVAALLVLALLGGRRWIASLALQGSIDSIAVLPFVNAGGSPDADYLSEGIADTLTNNLTQIRGLRVVPRTLAAKYKDLVVDPHEAGVALNARAVVTGRVVQHGDRLSIQAELIDVANVAQLWGDQFDRPIADVLTLQADISKAIADNLRLRLSREDEQALKAGTPRDAVAYQLYLKGRYATNKRTRDGFAQATEYFNQAIARDAAYALAYAGLADAYISQAYWGYLPSAEGYAKAAAAAKRAVALDERTADAHASLGWISLYHDWNWALAGREYLRALALDPTNANIHALYGESLATRGRHDEAIAEIGQAIDLAPLSPTYLTNLGFVLTNARRFDEAIETLKQAIELGAQSTLAKLDLARVYRLAGHHDLAIAESRRMLDAGDPLGPAFVAMSYAHAGRRVEALPILKQLIDKDRQSHQSSMVIALVFASLGDREQAFEWLERAYREHDTFLPWLKTDPELEILRSDARFDDLVRRIGIPDR